MSLPVLAERCLVLGDSISAGVYTDSAVADPSSLWVNRLPARVGIAVSNLSSPGLSITNSGPAGFGLVTNLNAITMTVGYFGAKWAIITAGTNDTDSYGVTLVEYIESLRKVIVHCRALGLIVIFVSPIWRGDIAVVKPHVDGYYSFEAFRVYGEMVAFEENAKPGPSVHIFTGLQAPLLPQHFIADQVHLNASGHDVFTDWIIEKMQSVGYWCG